MTSDVSHQWMELKLRWRRMRRKFDARMMNERRILIVAALCVSWFLIDAVWVTPSYQKLKKSLQQQRTVKIQQQKDTNQYNTVMQALNEQKQKASVELARVRARLMQQQAELDEVQAQMAPARDMRKLLDALLAKQGGLHVLSMKTIAPVEVRAPGSQHAVVYRHGLDLEIGGRFHDLLSWMRSVENLPHRLIWGGMRLKSDAETQLVLQVQVFTISPDKQALEIGP